MDAYIDWVLKIQKEGLKPTPFGGHHDMDRQIQPVYCVPDPGYAYGLLFFGFQPGLQGLTVFIPEHMEEERLIYATHIEGPLKLFLKSSTHYLDGKDDAEVYGDGDNAHPTYREYRHFRDQIEQRLRVRDISFELHDYTT